MMMSNQDTLEESEPFLDIHHRSASSDDHVRDAVERMHAVQWRAVWFGRFGYTGETQSSPTFRYHFECLRPIAVAEDYGEGPCFRQARIHISRLTSSRHPRSIMHDSGNTERCRFVGCSRRRVWHVSRCSAAFETHVGRIDAVNAVQLASIANVAVSRMTAR